MSPIKWPVAAAVTLIVCGFAPVALAGHIFSFEYSGGVYTDVNPPIGPAYEYSPTVINASGTIAGMFGYGQFNSGFLASGGNYTIINVPGAFSTSINTLTDTGIVAGNFQRTTSASHGFTYQAGQYTEINRPGALYTDVAGVNDSGTVIGGYYISGSNLGSFVESGGVFSDIAVPGGSFTSLTAINDPGEIIGEFNNGANHAEGFSYSAGQYSIIDPPGAVNTYVTAINDAGIVAGTFYNSSNVEKGFTEFGGNYSYFNIDIPGAVGSFSVSAINNSNSIVGGFFNAGQPEGYLDSAGVFTIINFPGSVYTVATDVNDAGIVVGSATGAPEPAAWAMMLVGFGGLGVAMRWRRRNPSPQ